MQKDTETKYWSLPWKMAGIQEVHHPCPQNRLEAQHEDLPDNHPYLQTSAYLPQIVEVPCPKCINNWLKFDQHLC